MPFEGFTNQSGETTTSGGSDDDTNRDEQDTTTTSTDPNDGTGFESRGDTTTSGGATDTSQDSTDSGSSGSGDQSTTTQQTTTQEFTGQEQEAVNQFLKENQAYSREDIADVQEQEDDAYSFTFTESGRRTYFDENYSAGAMAGPAPAMASQLQSESGETATVVFNQGIETGSGDVAEQAQQFEDQIVESTPGVDESDVSIDFNAETGQFEAEIDREAAREAARQRAEGVVQQAEDAGIIQPDAAVGGDATDYSSIGGDATTVSDRELQQGEAEERARGDISERLSDPNSELYQELEGSGIDPDSVEIDTAATADGVQVNLSRSGNQEEQFGDFEIRLPTAGGKQSQVGRVVGDALGAVAPWSLGPATDEVAELAADEAGIGGERMEDVLGEASDEFQAGAQQFGEWWGKNNPTVAYWRTVQTARDELGISDAARSVLGEDTVDAVLGAEEQALQTTESFATGVGTGVAGIADVPGAALGAKEGAEFVGYGATKVAQGETDEFVSQTTDAGELVVDAAVSAFEENPTQMSGQVAGALVASAGVVGGASKVSSGAGRATRFLIDPAEEVLQSAARRGATRAIRGGRSLKNQWTSTSDLSFLSDTRAQMDFGQQTIQKQRFRDGDEVETTQETSFEDLEDQGLVEVYNAESQVETVPELELEAKERLPEQAEYPSEAEYLSEVEQMMRRVEQDQLNAESSGQVTTKQEQELEATADQQRAIEAEAVSLGLMTASTSIADPVADQLEGEMFADGESDMRLVTDTDLDQSQQVTETLAIESQETTGELDTGQILEVGVQTDVTVDTTSDLQMQTELTQEVTTDLQLDLEIEGDTKRRELELDDIEGGDDLLTDFGDGVKQKRYEYELRDLV